MREIGLDIFVILKILTVGLGMNFQSEFKLAPQCSFAACKLYKNEIGTG